MESKLAKRQLPIVKFFILVKKSGLLATFKKWIWPRKMAYLLGFSGFCPLSHFFLKLLYKERIKKINNNRPTCQYASFLFL